MTRIEKLAAILGLTYGDEKTFALQYALDRAEESIKNYCNLDQVPEGLDHTALAMAVDLYRAENPGAEAAAVGPVTSLAEGDATVSFGGAVSSEHPGMAFLKDYAALLNRYRKAGW